MILLNDITSSGRFKKQHGYPTVNKHRASVNFPNFKTSCTLFFVFLNMSPTTTFFMLLNTNEEWNELYSLYLNSTWLKHNNFPRVQSTKQRKQKHNCLSYGGKSKRLNWHIEIPFVKLISILNTLVLCSCCVGKSYLKYHNTVRKHVSIMLSS